MCTVQLEGHFDGNKAACVSVRGSAGSLQPCPEIHLVTKNYNSKSMTPSKSSQTVPKIIEQECRVSAVQSELGSWVLCSDAWDLMEMGRQPGDPASQYRTGRALMLGPVMRKGSGIESLTSQLPV
jgi:hypothetical protein